MKQQATSYLIHAKMPLQLWYWATKQAAYIYRARVLGVRLPTDATTFGNRVLIRDPRAEGNNFVIIPRRASFCAGAPRGYRERV